MSKKGKSLLSCILIAAILAAVFFAPGMIKGKEGYPDTDINALAAKMGGDNEKSFSKFYSQHQQEQVSKSVTAFVANEPMTIKEDTTLTRQIRVEKAGLYTLSCQIQSQSNSYVYDYGFSMLINGESQFPECQELYFPKSWVDLSGKTVMDSKGNQLLPALTEQSTYSAYARNRSSYYSAPLCFYLREGDNTVAITASNQDIGLQSLTFAGYSEPQTYEQLQATYADKGYAPSTKSIVINAEKPQSRSASSILEQIDRTSPATVPVCGKTDIYNTIGGNSWRQQGEAITWSFTVEQSGLYQFDMRCRQDYTSGVSSYRRLYIDGAIPCADVQILSIPYASGFQRVTAMNGGQPAEFYLSEGEHTITLECTLGEMEKVLQVVSNISANLNTAYRKILMITGSTPDTYRDYSLKQKLPEVFDNMQEQLDTLKKVSGYLSARNGGGSETSTIDTMIQQLTGFLENPGLIQLQMKQFNANISAIGDWALNRTYQPLELDWLEFIPNSQGATPVKAGFFKDFAYSCRRLAYSYIVDYDNLGGTGAQTKNITVWAATGRDQAQIIKRLCEDNFTPNNNIGVDFKLVQQGMILSAVVAGVGPDVSLFNNNSDAVNYATRKAVVDLSKYDGFDQTMQDFYPSASVPFRFNGGVYALPETQHFPVMFYRTDIFKEMGLELPKTWDDVFNVVADLQKSNMQFGLPLDAMSAYFMFLYQNGGKLYNGDGISTDIDSSEGVKAFETWTGFYTDYQSPLSYNFLSRFRTGEMPIAIQEYSTYNSLVVFAPEIRNEWAIAQVPGTVRADGSIDRSVFSGGTCVFMFTACQDKESAWNFIRWWVGGEAQGLYARNMEIRLGPQARVSVANKTAFANQMWTKEQANQLQEQWKYVVGTPEVPGGYFTPRHISNAFRKVTYYSNDCRETLLQYARIIDKELTVKRQEFGLPTTEGE